MLGQGFYNMDCMEGMKQFPDKFFDLAICDPPYGINVASHKGGKIVGGGTDPSGAVRTKSTVYGKSRKALANQNPIIPAPTTVHRTTVISESWRG
jgi:DNA modification methylase